MAALRRPTLARRYDIIGMLPTFPGLGCGLSTSNVHHSVSILSLCNSARQVKPWDGENCTYS